MAAHWLLVMTAVTIVTLIIKVNSRKIEIKRKQS